MAGMRLGFIGAGSIASAVIDGLCAAPHPPDHVLVSPRNAGKAAALAARHACVTIAHDNQAVLDGSDRVVLAVRPQIAREVLASLRFRADHHVLSLIAILPLRELAPLVAPALSVVRAVPLPSAARRVGPIAFTPADQGTEALLQKIGTPLAVASESEFESLWTLTSLIAPYFNVVATASSWAKAQGVPDVTADRYASVMFHALSMLLADEHADPTELAREAQTRGGLNEQVLQEWTAAGAYTALGASLDRIRARLEAGSAAQH
jgi:pyrroline-5-carboxylate reductase